METNVLNALIRQINEESKTVAVSLAAGTATTYEEYKYQCGRLRGLAYAVEALTDMRARLSDEGE